MPIVFVHGVNNRIEDDFHDNEVGRNGFLREIVAPALKLPPKELTLSSPYWGGNAAKFAWNMAVLPNALDTYQTFGGGGEADARRRTLDLLMESGLSGSMVEYAKKDFPAAVDLLFGATLAAALTEEEARDIAASYLQASAYAEKYSSPDWLPLVNDNNFVDTLNAKVHASVQGAQTFGAGGLLDSLKEGLDRLKNAVPDVGSALVGELARKKLNASTARFTGDAFVYFKRPQPIIDIVLKAFHDAAQAKTATDDKLIVIAHSFGGEITYDIITFYDTNLQVDCLITVGSQVGLFEEMKLYNISRDNIPPDAPTGKVKRPANLKRWLNVFDTNDIFSYRAEPVYNGVSDYLYDTGFSAVQAHSGYFLRPSFYKRLAARLTQVG